MAPLSVYTASALAVFLGSAHAQLRQCGGAFYDPTQYTCYNENGSGLCPVINGVATKLCGTACYSSYMYSCTDSTLAPLPTTDGEYTLTAINPTAPFNGAAVQASGQHFFIGLSEPSTYCPSPPVSNATCASLGNQTVFADHAMAVMVPGGQATFVQTNGALAYTQAHSASMFNLSSQDTRAYVGGGYFGPGGVGLTACPAQGGGGRVAGVCKVSGRDVWK
ncbi:hypothetical protein H2203_001104 [Taxawa tesnikishii (nom. ined.)]|nr:hypothetical protein H2203_001104 [Dothideales sp. JES 119]